MCNGVGNESHAVDNPFSLVDLFANERVSRRWRDKIRQIVSVCGESGRSVRVTRGRDMRRSVLTLAQIPLYSGYRQSPHPPGRGVVNCSGSSHPLFAIRSRLSTYASCNRPSGFEFVLGYHHLARGHRRIQPSTKGGDISPSLFTPHDHGYSPPPLQGTFFRICSTNLTVG